MKENIKQSFIDELNGLGYGISISEKELSEKSDTLCLSVPLEQEAINAASGIMAKYGYFFEAVLNRIYLTEYRPAQYVGLILYRRDAQDNKLWE